MNKFIRLSGLGKKGKYAIEGYDSHFGKVYYTEDETFTFSEVPRHDHIEERYVPARVYHALVQIKGQAREVV